MEFNSEIVRFENKVTDYANPTFSNNKRSKMQEYQSAVKLKTRLVRTKTRTVIIISVLAVLLAAGIITAVAVTLTSSNDDSDLDPNPPDPLQNNTATTDIPNSFNNSCNATGQWINIPECKPISCGIYTTPANSQLSMSGTTLNSSVSVTCNVGYKLSDNETILCTSNGTWSKNVTCEPTDCGIISSEYYKTTDTAVSTKYNSSVNVSCIIGLSSPSGMSGSVLTCQSNGIWSGIPNCTIPGSLAFTSEKYIFGTGEQGVLTCEVKQYQQWQTGILAKLNEQNNIPEPIFLVSNRTGSVMKNSTNPNVNVNSTENIDGVIIKLYLDPATCDVEGTYMCATYVGNDTSPLQLVTSNTSVVTITDSTTPSIIVPDKVYFGRETNIQCVGQVGRNASGYPNGQLFIEAYFGNGSFVTLQGTDQVNALKCGDNQTIIYTIPAGEALSNVTVKCVVLDNNGTRLESENKTIDVLKSYVAFENSSYVFNIGENASLTCEIENFENWNQVEIWRPNNSLLLRYNKTVDRQIALLYSDSRVSFIGSKSNLNDSSGKITVEISPVRCNDSGGRIGAVDYVCRVVNTETTAEINGTTQIQFQRLPKKPELIMSREIIEGRWTLGDRPFICKGDVGNPPGHIEIESDFNGSFSTFLALFPGQNKTNLGIIVERSYSDATVPSENCGFNQILTFGFEKVLFDYMVFKHLRCVTKPSSDLKNGLTLYSNEAIVKIIPDDYCKNNVVYGFHRPHPYFCHLAVQCDGSGRIIGVSSPCRLDQCAVITSTGNFYCDTCDSVTCLPPDIFCDHTTIASYKSSSVVYNCDITEVGSVSHITVNNHSASIASQNETLNLWNNVVFSIKDGHFVLKIGNVSCLDEGNYTVKLNNKSSVALVLKVLTKPEGANLFLPDVVSVNQEVNVTCSGNIGRNKYGKNLSAIYLEVNLTGSTGFTVFSSGEKRSGLTETECQISESVKYTFIADHRWNNSYVRCVARNSTDIVSASAEKHLILQIPGIYCDAVMKTAKIDDSTSFTCYLKDITNISSLSVRDNTSELLNVQNKVPPFSEVKDDVNLTMLSVKEILVNFTNITCIREGEYTIEVNDATSAKFNIRIISDPAEPTLYRPSTGALNMQYNVTCSGSLGRDIVGKPVTSMQLQVKFANESGFTVYNTSIMREAVSYASCQYNETIRLILYPDEQWNNSMVRCAVMNNTNAVKYSTEQTLIFGSADIYFNETAPIGYVGESLILTCVVENMPGLSDIIIKKGNGRTEVAKLTTNYTIDGTKIIYADSRIVNNTGVLKINVTVKCGDDKDYYCTASGTKSETPSEDVLSVAGYWKASKPVLDPSSDMVENTAVIWGDGGFDTRCTGELGFHNATIYMQVEHSDGTVTNITRNIVTSSYNVKMCSNKQTIKFDQRYQSSWNGSIIRCIVDTGKETYVDAEYVRIIPATYCDDVNVSATVTVTKPHPFDCRAFLTCTNTTKKIIPQRPNAQCTVDECYNVNDPSKCVSCGDKCRPDPLQDALPHMICEDKTAKIGSSASIICTLYNIMVENVSIPSILITRQSSVWFNTKNVEPVASSLSEATFNVSTGIKLIVRKANVELKFLSGPLCADEGDFTFQYDGTTTVQDTSKITVQSDPGRPELSKTPENFYRGQEMTLTCSGCIGKPKSTLSLKRKSPSDGQFEVVQGVVIEYDIYDPATCAFNRTLSYAFVVSSSLENTTYKCETTGSNGTSYSSSNETVKIKNALVGFANDAETAEIELRKQIQCVLINYDGQSSVNVSRQTLIGKEDICSVDNNNLVLRTEGFNCTLHTDGNNGIVTVNILVVSCETEGTYYCESLGMKGSMQLSVTRNATKPVLKLPQDNAVIENVVIPQSDPIVCTADVGYPANDKELKIQFKLNNSNVFVDFLKPTVVTDCTQNATVTTTWNTRLNLTFDGASFRCGIFENGNISSESPVKTLRVISNDCPSSLNGTTSVYLPHPLNCHKYIWCYSSGIAVQSCPGAGCFNITAAATAAGGLCDDMSCGNATCTS